MTSVRRALNALEFDDLAPTTVIASPNRLVIDRKVHARVAHATAANVDDVVEELRAAAAGRKARVRELESKDLLDEGADASSERVHQVDESELVFDRPVTPREVWNVRQAARPTELSIMGPTEAPTRFLATAALAMFVGACLAIAVALVAWRLTGFHL